MTYRVLLISGEGELGEQLRRALASIATVMRSDPSTDAVQDVAAQFAPDCVIADSDFRMGASTAYERLSSVRQWFPELPYLVIGNEAGAQLILTAMRAGASDFIDRDAPDDEVLNVVQRHIAANVRARRDTSARFVAVMSGGSGDEDRDLAVNLASLIAERQPQDGVLLVDLSLPASDAGIALNMDLPFLIKDAVREMSRLDRTLLDSALARCPRTGLYVLPLAIHGDAEEWFLDAQDLGAVLEVLRSLYKVVVIAYGPFSRREDVLRLPGEDAEMIVPCNQRFSSVKAGAEIIALLKSVQPSGAAPMLAVHEYSGTMVPQFEAIRQATNAQRAIRLRTSWDSMTEALNSGVPLSVSGRSSYTEELEDYLESLSLIPGREEARTANQPLLAWASKLLG